MIDKKEFSDHVLAHEMNGEKLNDKQKNESEATKFRQKLQLSDTWKKPPEDVKNNNILDIDDILKKEEAL